MATKNDSINPEELPAEVVEVTPEVDEVILMDNVDTRTGILFEIEAARAQARLQAIYDSAQIFAAQMREKYGASEKTHEMTDWITGFRKVKKE